MARREAAAAYLKGALSELAGGALQVLPFGSVPLRTYLPDGDNDLAVFVPPGGGASNRDWADCIAAALREAAAAAAEAAAAGGPSPWLDIQEVHVVSAEVPVAKCLVDGLLFDLSVNTLNGLSTLAFVEEVSQAVDVASGCSGLFKDSLLLIKAWCYYEGRLLGAPHGLVSTYALEVLTLHVLQAFPSRTRAPLEALRRFLEYYAAFDWEAYGVALEGVVPLEGGAGPGTAEGPAGADARPLLEPDLLEGLALRYGLGRKKAGGAPRGGAAPSDDATAASDGGADGGKRGTEGGADGGGGDGDEEVNPAKVAPRGGEGSRGEGGGGETAAAAAPQGTGRPGALAVPGFRTKYLNVVDPLLPTNNLGRSVGKASLYRIRMALQLGAERLRGICEEAREAGGSIAPEETERRMLDDFFRNTMQARSPPSSQALSAVPRQPHFVPPAADFILEGGCDRDEGYRGEGEWEGEGGEEEGLREEEAWGGVRVPGGAEVLQPLAGLLNSLPAEGAPPPHAGGFAPPSKALPGRESASGVAAKATGPALAASAFPFRPPAAREFLCRSPDPCETARAEGETEAELRERLETAHRNLALAQQCLNSTAPQTAAAADAAVAAGKGERSTASAAAPGRGTSAREGPGPRRGAGGETRSGSQGGGGRRGRGGEGKEGGGRTGRRKSGRDRERDRGKDGGGGGRPHPKQPPPPVPASASAASPFALRPDDFPSLGA